MNQDTLFLKTLEDLERKSTSNDVYEIFMSSALLRKLLLDENPLIHQVNKNRRLKITFIINDRPLENLPGLVLWSVQDGFDPETAHSSNPQEVPLDKMLKAPVMIIQGQVISTQDLIKFLSHVEGAVHAGNPSNKKEEVLHEAEKFLTIGGMPGGVRSLLAINRVVLKALKPLRDAIEKSVK